jgi:hypothetical protein
MVNLDRRHPSRAAGAVLADAGFAGRFATWPMVD